MTQQITQGGKCLTSTIKGTRLVLVLICTVATSLLAQSAEAFVATNASQQCDAVLLPQITITTATRDQRLAVVSLITRENYEQVKQSFGVNAVIEGIPLGANYDQFNDNRSKSSEFKSFKYSDAEARTIIRQSLSTEQIKAWVQCMSLGNTVGIKLILTNDNKDGVNVKLRYDGTVDTKFTFTVEIDGGTVKNQTKFTRKLSAGGENGFLVKRKVKDKTIYIVVNGGQMTDEAASMGAHYRRKSQPSFRMEFRKCRSAIRGN